MKKLCVVLLMLCLCLSVTSCDNSGEVSESAASQTVSSQESADESEEASVEVSAETSAEASEEVSEEVSEDASEEVSPEESVPEVSEEESVPEVSQPQGFQNEEIQNVAQSYLWANRWTFGMVGDDYNTSGIFSNDYENLSPLAMFSFVYRTQKEALKEYVTFEEREYYTAELEATIPVSVIAGYAKEMFGYEYDFTKATGNILYECEYKPESDSIYVNLDIGGFGGPEDGYIYQSFVQVDDITVDVTLGFQVYDEEYNTTIQHTAVLKLQKQQSGQWRVMSFAKNA